MSRNRVNVPCAFCFRELRAKDRAELRSRYSKHLCNCAAFRVAKSAVEADAGGELDFAGAIAHVLERCQLGVEEVLKPAPDVVLAAKEAPAP